MLKMLQCWQNATSHCATARGVPILLLAVWNCQNWDTRLVFFDTRCRRRSIVLELVIMHAYEKLTTFCACNKMLLLDKYSENNYTTNPQVHSWFHKTSSLFCRRIYFNLFLFLFKFNVLESKLSIDNFLKEKHRVTPTKNNASFDRVTAEVA